MNITSSLRFTHWLLLLVPGLLLLAACEPNGQQPSIDLQQPTHATAQQKVEAVVRVFVDASIKRDFASQYQVVSSADKQVKTLDQYVAEKAPRERTLADSFYQQISYSIEDVKVGDDQALVRVAYRFPDVERMIKERFGLSVLGKITDEKFDSMRQQLEAAYQNKVPPMKHSTRDYQLRKESSGWRIYLGWDKATQNSSASNSR